MKTKDLVNSLCPKLDLLRIASCKAYEASLQINPCRKIQKLIDAQHLYRLARFHATAAYIQSEIEGS